MNINIKEDAIDALTDYFHSINNRPSRIKPIREYVKMKCKREINSNTFYGVLYEAKKRNLIVQSGRGEYLLAQYPLAAEAWKADRGVDKLSFEYKTTMAKKEDITKESKSTFPLSDTKEDIKEQILSVLEIKNELKKILDAPIQLGYTDKHMAPTMQALSRLSSIVQAMEDLEQALKGNQEK